ncbi:MAG: HEAT repeat domain-containing protein [Bdellovibrionota bacterium]
MRISSLNSKKCSKAKPVFAALAGLFLFSLSVHAAVSQIPFSSGPQDQIRSEIRHRPKGSFDPLIGRWERRYGTQAVAPLLKIAGEKSQLADDDRYVALMGAAKIGGTQIAPLILPFLKDSSWMLRSAALSALSVLGNPRTAEAVVPLIRDPALVVRSAAVDAIIHLRPLGAVDALSRALDDPENYHGGKALWVPQKALAGLVSLHATSQISKLQGVLARSRDPEMKRQVAVCLRALKSTEIR